MNHCDNDTEKLLAQINRHFFGIRCLVTVYSLFVNAKIMSNHRYNTQKCSIFSYLGGGYLPLRNIFASTNCNGGLACIVTYHLENSPPVIGPKYMAVLSQDASRGIILSIITPERLCCGLFSVEIVAFMWLVNPYYAGLVQRHRGNRELLFY